MESIVFSFPVTTVTTVTAQQQRGQRRRCRHTATKSTNLVLLLCCCFVFVCSVLPCEAVTFRDCWLLFGGVDDIGYSHATNLARLELNQDLREKYPEHNFETKAYPGTFFLSEDDRENVINDAIWSGCNCIVSSSDPLLNNRHLEYAAQYPNISFVQVTGSPIIEVDTTLIPNLVNIFGSWFNASFVSGAVAASQSTTCAGFINALETQQSTWSHAMAFTLGYQWVKPNQTVHMVTMDGYFNPASEVQAARQVYEQFGCDVFGRHTDPNDVDKYINQIPGQPVLSIARYVDMSTFVGDTVFHSVKLKALESYFPPLEAALMGVVDGGDMMGTFVNLPLPKQQELELSAFTSAANQTSAYDMERVAFAFLEAENPLCDALTYRDGTPLDIDDGKVCPDANTIFFPKAYLQLDKVIYYDSFQDGGTVCGAGEFYTYDSNLQVTCSSCPENTYYNGNSRSQEGVCADCPEGTSSNIGASQCTKVETNKAVPIAVSVTALVVVLGILIGAYIVLKKHKAQTRDNSDAPKLSDQSPIAVMFTDIQASTTIWANAPEEMAMAVEAHHDLIRMVIKRHSGYEVKTIGDAFMVVHDDINKAVKIALEIQQALHQYDWGTDQIDKVYAMLQKEKGKAVPYGGEDNGEAPRTLSTESRCWNGLRIRIGISYGTCTGQKDPVTGGWDYYGNTVNMGARVEAAAYGGQVLITGSAYKALLGSGSKVNSLALNLTDKVQSSLGLSQIQSHGGVMLRGITKPVELYEVTPDVPGLMERTFPPLQGAKEANALLERQQLASMSDSANSLGYQTADESDSSDEDDERPVGEELLVLSPEERIEGLIKIALRATSIRRYDATLTNAVQEFYEGLKSLVSLYKPPEKHKLLDEMLTKWHLRVPNISEQLLDKVGHDTPKLLMLSVRAATVTLAKKKPFLLNSMKI